MARRKDMGIAIAVGFDDGRRDPVAPESFSGSQSQPNADWPGLIASNPDNPRYTAVTPNGVAHQDGNGHNQTPFGNWNKRASGERWQPGSINWDRYGRANRTGE
jgi:hypothetical protein